MALHLSHREKRIFVLCLITIFIYVSYHYGFVSLKEKKDALQLAVKTKERELRKNLGVVERGKVYDGEYQRILDKFKQTASDEKTMSSLLSEIEQVAGDTKMRISEMKPQRVRKVDFYNNFSVSLTMDDSLTEIMHFLYVLQDDIHRFSVDELRFDKMGPNVATLRCQLVISKVFIP